MEEGNSLSNHGGKLGVVEDGVYRALSGGWRWWTRSIAAVAGETVAVMEMKRERKTRIFLIIFSPSEPRVDFRLHQLRLMGVTRAGELAFANRSFDETYTKVIKKEKEQRSDGILKTVQDGSPHRC